MRLTEIESEFEIGKDFLRKIDCGVCFGIG